MYSSTAIRTSPSPGSTPVSRESFLHFTITARAALLLTLEYSRLAQEFELPADEIVGQMQPLLRQLSEDAHKTVMDVHKHLAALKKPND